jgi:hypothetical protein
MAMDRSGAISPEMVRGKGDVEMLSNRFQWNPSWQAVKGRGVLEI